MNGKCESRSTVGTNFAFSDSCGKDVVRKNQNNAGL